MSKSVVYTQKYVLKNVIEYMERLVTQQLNAWKASTHRKPLILNGARQVGKTWALREFAHTCYAKEAYIVCRKNALIAEVFRQGFDTDRLLRSLRVISGVDITPNDTLIILDEIQEVPEAIEALKYFCEEAPQYHIAVAGSLLGLSLHNRVSFPVGKVDILHLYPMNFYEFLLAKGEGEACKLLQARDYATMRLLHSKYVDLLRQYFYVGGMPEAVRAYVETGGVNEVRTIQQNILRGYELDFSKHAPREQVERIRMVWQSIPAQLFKENKKFVYGALRKGARAKDFELAIQWLIDAGLLYKVSNCSKIALPLSIYEEFSVFKLYLSDVGFLGAMAHTDASQVLIDDKAFTEYKGGFTEQYVLQQMLSEHLGPIYYHKADNSRLEIDFLMQRQGFLVPIEVKGGTHVRANSLSALLKSDASLHAIRYSMLPYQEQGNLTCIPLYAV